MTFKEIKEHLSVNYDFAIAEHHNVTKFLECLENIKKGLNCVYDLEIEGHWLSTVDKMIKDAQVKLWKTEGFIDALGEEIDWCNEREHLDKETNE